LIADDSCACHSAFTNNEIAVMKAWARALPVESETSEMPEDSLGTFANLCEPYLRFLAASDTDIYERGVKAREYFDSTILPLDFTDLVANIANREQWEKNAVSVFSQALAHPHGIRGIFEASTQEFLWRLLPPGIEQIVSSDVIDQILCDAKTVPARTSTAEEKANILPTLFAAPALLECLPSASPAKLAGPLGMAVVRIQRSLLGFNSPEDVKGAGCAGLDDVREARDGLVSRDSETGHMVYADPFAFSGSLHARCLSRATRLALNRSSPTSPKLWLSLL
jgi:hypothetical protein